MIETVMLFILILFLIFYGYRIYWVFKNRKKILFNDIERYEELASFDEMICKFWIWNINKF